MAKKVFIAGAFVALMIVIGISIYYRAFWERDPEQLSEAGQMAVDLAEVLREQETAREVERAAEARQEELQARRAAWEEIRSAIEEARHARSSASASASAESEREPDQASAETGQAGQAGQAGHDTEENYGTLDPSYIRDAMQEMKPLLAECYELAREEAPELQGRLVLNYTIGGEPEVGGVVEVVYINEESELRHPLLDECVRETIYTTELPAPEEGGRVEVTYPVHFAPADPDETESAEVE